MTKDAKISDLTPDPRNANRGTQRGRGMLDTSLRKYGAGRSILLDRKNRIIAGNKTTEAAADIGLDDVVIVESDGTKLVAVKRTDLDLDDPRARELAYADNRIAEADLDFDPAQIAADLAAGVDLSALWTDAELKELVTDTGGGSGDGDAEPQIDRAAELQEKWGTATGQLWAIGKHRLLCGDSTRREDVERVMGGTKPNLMVTDPPYGVEYDPAWRNEAADKGLIAHAAIRVGNVENDDRVDWREAWKMFDGNVIYCWHADRHASKVQDSIESCGFEIRCQIVWAKQVFSISRGNYHWQHEPCWYAVRKGQRADWIGDRSQSTLWAIGWDKNVDGGHGTQKPLECMMRPIRNHRGDVFDPFLGSGTTLVACERLGRIGRGIEISPAYVAVTLERMATAFPGIEIRLVS